MVTSVQILSSRRSFPSLGHTTRNKVAAGSDGNSRVVVFCFRFVFEEAAYCFPGWLCYITVCSGSDFSTPSPTLVTFWVCFYTCRPSGCEGVAHHVLMCAPPVTSGVEHLSVCCGPLVRLRQRNLYSSPLPVFKWVHVCLVVELRESFTSWNTNPYQTRDLQASSPVPRLSFHSVDRFLCCAKVLKFDVLPFVYFCFCCGCFWCPTKSWKLLLPS